MKINPDILIQIFPNCRRLLVYDLVRYMNLYLTQFGIDTKLEIDHFLAQAAKETDSFKVLKEYASGEDYEGREDLGNVYPGDGVKFKGHGLFHTTGRTNHAIAGKKILENEIFGKDRLIFANNAILKNPELLATPQWAVASACIYWVDRDLSSLCQPDNTLVIIKRKIGGKWVNYSCYPIEAISRKVNGGLNGFEERKLFYHKISQWNIF